MKRIYLSILPWMLLLAASADILAQTGNFSTMTLTGTSGNLLQATGAGVQVLSLSNDEITGVNSIRINDVGIGEGLIFSDQVNNEIDISVASESSGGINAFMMRTNQANPFYFRSPGEAKLSLNATSIQGFFGTSLILSSKLLSGNNQEGAVTYNNSPSHVGSRLNLTHNTKLPNGSTLSSGLHIGADNTWVDKSLHIRSALSGGMFPNNRQEILFQTGGLGSDQPVLNASIYHNINPPGTGSNFLHAVKQNDFGVHMSNNTMFFGDPIGSGIYEQYNFPGSVKASKLLIGNFSSSSASRFPRDGSFRLAVDGKSICSNAIVTAIKTSWPDYVFSKDYSLMPLEELHAYVKENQHLPEVPAANDVADGINLGEMHPILLKKIEELMLYTIQVNEQIKTLEKENELLEAQLKKRK